MNDFDVVSCQAVVESATQNEDTNWTVVLDQTCFYARGGGQDWDTGTIKQADSTFNVHEVRLDETGTVHHIGTFSGQPFDAGASVDCAVDTDRRLLNTRLHSAAHVLDMAVDAIGLDWVATKGQHYPDLSAIEYAGSWDPEKAEQLKQDIEAQANTSIAAGSQNRLMFMPVAEMHKYCRHVPENLPQNKPARLVIYGEDFGIPCGGTHVKDIADVGSVSINKLKHKKGKIRLSYAIN